MRVGALRQLEEAAPPAKESVSFSDGTPEGVKRFIRNESGRFISLLGEGAVAAEGLKACVFCRDAASLEAVLSGAELPQGTFVSVSREVPEPEPGGFVVSFELDSDRLGRIAPQEPLSRELLGSLSAAGIPEGDVRASVMMDRIAEHGHFNGVLSGVLSLSESKVNGVPAAELSERLNNKRLAPLDRDGVSRWIGEAARIRAVHVEVDARKGVLKINTVVGNNLYCKTEKLSDDDVRSFAARGKISRGEMKDLVMGLYPEMFRMYSAGGKSMFRDPVGDFVKGRKPATVSEVVKELAQERKKRVAATKRNVPSF